MVYSIVHDLETINSREAVNTTEPVIQNSRYACYLNSDKVIVYFRQPFRELCMSGHYFVTVQ